MPDKKITLAKAIISYDMEHDHIIDFGKLLPNGKSFFTAVETCTDDDVNFLIEQGVDPNAPEADGFYPLEHAIMKKQPNFALALIKSNKIDFSKQIPYKKEFSPNYGTLRKTDPKYTSYLHLAVIHLYPTA